MATNKSGDLGCLIVIGGIAVVLTVGLAADLSYTGWFWLWAGTFAAVALVSVITVEHQRERQLRANQAWAEAQEQKYRALTLSQVDSMKGVDFERYLQRVFAAQDYDVQLTKASGDLGVDLILVKDSDRIAVQVKRYGTTISRRAISDAVAGMRHYQCSKAMVVTNNHFTPGAITLARSNECILIDRATLADWITQYSLDGRTETVAEEKRIILCPRCEQKLRIPAVYKTLRLRCYTCRHQFQYPAS